MQLRDRRNCLFSRSCRHILLGSISNEMKPPEEIGEETKGNVSSNSEQKNRNSIGAKKSRPK